MADAKNAYLSMDKQKSFIILSNFKFLLILTRCVLILAMRLKLTALRFIILYPYVMNDKTITFIFITGKIFALNKTLSKILTYRSKKLYLI